MFGIGLPEMILIMALALIVVGPDKLPELARSLAKGLTELKKTAEGIKEQLTEEGNPLDDIKPDLEQAARSLKDNLLNPPEQFDRDPAPPLAKTSQGTSAAEDAYSELLQHTTNRQDIPNPVEGNADRTTPVQVDGKEPDVNSDPEKQ